MIIKQCCIVLTFLTIFTSFTQAQQSKQEFAICEYKFDEFNGYKCELTLNIPNGIAEIDEIEGSHEPNMTDDDVLFIETTFVSSSEYIPAIICNKFRNTQKISMQTGLEKIDAEALKGCKSLQNLNLFFNKIREISEKAFAENKELNFVDLTGNQLSTLPQKLFQSQHDSLNTLLLQDNRNLLLPIEFFNHTPNLTTLSLTIYHPGWFLHLENLEELHIGSSGVVELPKNLFNPLKNLKLLFINEKNVTTLHADTFGELPNLQQLWMKNNGIVAIDEKIFDQTGLKDVNLEGNVCVDGRFSGDKRSILRGLKRCFENFKGI